MTPATASLVRSLPRPKEIMDSTDVLQALCRLKGMYGMVLHTEQVSDEAQSDLCIPGEYVRPAPYLSVDDIFEGDRSKRTWLFFETEAEMEACYWATVGPDGPVGTNPYDGPACIYAISCGPDGELRNENT